MPKYKDWKLSIEPLAYEQGGDYEFQLAISQAISLKRIADALERFIAPAGIESFTSQLIGALSYFPPRRE